MHKFIFRQTDPLECTCILINKDVVAHLVHSRGHCISSWPSVPQLHVAPHLACVVQPEAIPRSFTTKMPSRTGV